jgi:hypothetical protein
MANKIINLPNSFIRWCDARRPESCEDYNGVVLPYYTYSDYCFMLEIDDTTTTYLDTLSFYFIKGQYSEGDVVDATDVVGFRTLQYAVISGSNYAVWTIDPVCNPGIYPAPTLYSLADGECVSLVLLVASTRTIVCKSLQSFVFKDDLCWTKVLRYHCADNSYGFYYEEANETVANNLYFNSIRLPITLHSPAPATEKTGFRKSDGNYVTLGATKEKVWSVDTDWMTDHMHQCLDAAIDHDIIYIVDEVVSCEYGDYEFFHPEGDTYEIDWQEKPGQHLGIAKASFKLKTNPYFSQTSNC